MSENDKIRPRKLKWILLAAIIATAIFFRVYDLDRFSQAGGDDVEFRYHLPSNVRIFRQGLERLDARAPGPQSAFLAAVYLSHWDVNRTVTSFAKPFFLLELGLLDNIIGLSHPDPLINVFRLHLWMAFLGAATVVLVYLLAARLGGERAGLAAAFLVAVSPWAVRYSTWVLHVAGGGFWLVLALLAAVAADRKDRPLRVLLYGAILGIAVYYSTSMIWPAFFLAIFEILRRSYSAVAKRRPPRPAGRLVLFGAGLVLPLALWEGINALAVDFFKNIVGLNNLPRPHLCGLAEGPHTFLLRLLQTFKDNAGRSVNLPLDRIYFFRHLKDSDGWLFLALVSAALVYAVYVACRGDNPRRPTRLRLLFLFLGTAWIMNYSGGTQVARHYYAAALAGFVLAGDLVGKLFSYRPRFAAVIAGLVFLAGVWNFFRLEDYRRSRQGPARLMEWERQASFIGRIATPGMQTMDLWPTLTPVYTWEELRRFAAAAPGAHVMYSDYIGIAHGAWFYHIPDQFEMAQAMRRCEEVVFATDSYLSYDPMLYENEFYYWGLFRSRPGDFDPRIRVVPAREVFSVHRRLGRDEEYLDELRRIFERPPPVVIPAWRDMITFPYMKPTPRPSFLVEGILSAVACLAFTLYCFKKRVC